MIEESQPASHFPGRRVLVADDNRAAALTLTTLLELFDYDVVTCFDGQDALETAGRTRPEILLLDIGMPGLDGYELCRRLRAEPGFERSRIIAQTGRDEDEDREKARDAGFDMYIVKPVPVHILRMAMEGETDRFSLN